MVLNQEFDRSSGLSWEGAELNAEWLRAVREQPGFAAALMESNRMAEGVYRGQRLLNVLTNDRGRFIVSILALYLHYEGRPGLSATRLRALCAEQGICSQGRAAAMVTAMTWGGFLAPAPSGPKDRRLRLLVPTPKLIETHANRWRKQLEIMLPIFPQSAELLARFDEPAVFAAFALTLGSAYLGGFRMASHLGAADYFMDRNAGPLVMMTLVLGGEPGDSVPPKGWVTASAAGMAKRFHVSRTHMATLLKDAVEAGYLERQGQEPRYRISPELAEGIQDFFACVYIMNAMTARDALAMLNQQAA